MSAMSIHSWSKSVPNLLGIAMSGALLFSPLLHAQSFPERPVKIIVPYGAGGGADVFARVVGKGLEQEWKQGVVVDNRAGASGNIGTLEVVRAKADGYTLLLQNVSMATNYAIQGRLPYVPANDLTSILFLGSTPHIIVAHPKISVSNLQELMALIQKNPGTYAYGSCGIGSPQHFTMEVLKQTESLDMMHLGYKGCAPALTDVVGGQVPVAILSANLAAAYVNTGRLKAIGVTSSRRYGALPNVPTINEQGIKGFDYSGWYALMGPANMPADVVAKITAGVGKVLDDPAVRKTLDDSGIEVKRESAEQLSKTIADDSARYFNLARKLNLKAE